MISSLVFRERCRVLVKVKGSRRDEAVRGAPHRGRFYQNFVERVAEVDVEREVPVVVSRFFELGLEQFNQVVPQRHKRR